MSLWLDEGPVSQGKILTAILQQDGDKARHMLRQWAPGDLDSLENAAEWLQKMIRMERDRRNPR